MLACFTTQSTESTTPIHLITSDQYAAWLAYQTTFVRQWLASTQYRPEPGFLALIPNSEGQLERVLFCCDLRNNLWATGSLPLQLPAGEYYFDSCHNKQYDHYAIAWGLGAYEFTRYKAPKNKEVRLLITPCTDVAMVSNIVESIYGVRDLINTPTDDLGPTELGEAFMRLGAEYHADVKQIIGDELLKQNYASIYTVGRASDDAPRLLDLHWGDSQHPRVTLVGKGVCFDSGGLDIKPSSGMLLMKKDMGGAAHVMGLAHMIMRAQLPIRLRVLIPAVENAISGNAYRPGDVIKSRKGLTIEIGNTDAEGRVILADALTAATEEKPELIIDIATLTGAARIALGTELPAMFSNNDTIANDILLHAQQTADPMWRLPLFDLYRDALNSQVADINNNTADSYAGAITAALFLKEFVPDSIPWVHFDLMAWNLKARPGRPSGGEAMGLRGLFSYLQDRFA